MQRRQHVRGDVLDHDDAPLPNGCSGYAEGALGAAVRCRTAGRKVRGSLDVLAAIDDDFGDAA
jgi:hypothetical protein